MSEHLGAAGVPHLVLEKNRTAEAWRTARWDTLVANGPAWHDRFPNLEFEGAAPDEFVSKDRFAQYLVDYAAMINAPIREGVEVIEASRLQGQGGFLVRTSQGDIEARRIVAATGAFQHPVIPPIVPASAGVEQIHSFHYKNPRQLPDGAVMVVGAGSSGAQIADELNRAGRKVFLSVGPHDRPPRRYRGRDFVWWLGVLGLWDMAAPAPGTEHVTIAVSGAYGGRTMDFRRLASEGVTLTGLTKGYDNGILGFANDLQANVAAGDANYHDLLDKADAYVARMGLDLPEEPEARRDPARPRLFDQSDRPYRPGKRGCDLDHLGDGLSAGFQLAQGGCLRCQGISDPSSWIVDRAGRLFPRSALAVAARLLLSMGRLA